MPWIRTTPPFPGAHCLANRPGPLVRLTFQNGTAWGSSTHNLSVLRVCFEIGRVPVFGQKAGWRGATRDHPRSGAVTEEQQSQTAFCAKTLRAASFLPVACVGSFLTARCGDARNSPPWPRSKSFAAGTIRISKKTPSGAPLVVGLTRHKLVLPAGISPATSAFEARRSIY
jgi:hypothetical protein